MPQLTFLAEAGNPGPDGVQIDLDGVWLPTQPNYFLPLTLNFNPDQIVGVARVFRTARGLEVEADVPEHLLHGYPAVGVARVVAEDLPGAHPWPHRRVVSCELTSVSICGTPNADPTIARLSDQCPPAHGPNVSQC